MKTILVIFLTISFLLAQNKGILMSGGEIEYNREIRPLLIKPNSVKEIRPYDQLLGLSGSVDTLNHLNSLYDVYWNTNFGFFGQDYMVQWFEAPADMDILGIAIRSSDDSGPDISVWIVEVNWPNEKITTEGVTYLGYYLDSTTTNGITAFSGNDSVSRQWVDIEGNSATSPFGRVIWPDEGQKAQVKVNRDQEEVSWINIFDFGAIPSYVEGDLVAVAIKNESINLDGDRHGLFASKEGPGVPGYKFYANGRFSPGDGTPDPTTWGWWRREYNWDIALQVLLTGNRAPYITDIETPRVILWNDSTEISAVVSDDNPSGGPAGVEEVMLFYRLESDTSWQALPMYSSRDSLYKAIIPPIGYKDIFTFFIRARDVTGEKRYSTSHDIVVFRQRYKTLLVFNGYEDPTGFPQDYYFGGDNGILQFDHDVWSFDELSSELIKDYFNIIEICTNGLRYDNTRVIKEWIEAAPSHNYMVAGDEYLGSYSWPGVPTPYEPGIFFRDILGITVQYNEIVRSSSEKTPVRFIEGSILGDASFQYLKALAISADSVYYDPRYLIEQPNWLDGFEITDDSESFLQADSAGGYDMSPPVLSIGHSRVLPAGNKIAFLGYDPLSIHTGWDEDSPEYNWLGFSKHAPQVQVLNWFGIATNIKNEEKPKSPSGFSLHQNYPNPFNPSTTIEYIVRAHGNVPQRVKLTVYDNLAREITTLVDKKQPTGTYRVTFDASDLASGVYYYRLHVGSKDVILSLSKGQTRKMLLLK